MIDELKSQEIMFGTFQLTPVTECGVEIMEDVLHMETLHAVYVVVASRVGLARWVRMINQLQYTKRLFILVENW